MVKCDAVKIKYDTKVVWLDGCVFYDIFAFPNNKFIAW